MGEYHVRVRFYGQISGSDVRVRCQGQISGSYHMIHITHMSHMTREFRICSYLFNLLTPATGCPHERKSTFAPKCM